MKKLNFLIIALIATLNLNAQELIPNGGFEVWEWSGSDYTPSNWGVSIPANGGNCEQTDTRYLGSYSARFGVPNGSGNVRLYLENDINVTSGQQYTFRYWYDDSTDYGKFRHWASFIDAGGNQINYALDVLQPDFLPNTQDGWQEMVINLTAPANAVKFRLDFRAYDDHEENFSADIYLDEVSFKAGNMSVSDVENSKVSMTSVWNNTVNFNTKGNATVEIFNLNGQLVQKANGSNNFEVNVSNLTKGIYAVKVTVDGVATTQKVIKK